MKKKIVIDKKSWHYRLLKSAWGKTSEIEDICSYTQGFIFMPLAFLITGILFLSPIIGSLSLILGSQKYVGWGLSKVFDLLAGIGFILISVGIFLIKNMEPVIEKLRTNSTLTSLKGKYCLRVELKD